MRAGLTAGDHAEFSCTVLPAETVLRLFSESELLSQKDTFSARAAAKIPAEEIA